MNNIHMILAISLNDVIGYKNPDEKGSYLPWTLSADLKRFKELTVGHVVVMGRKTWETIPDKFRPLPNRENFVLTRDKDYTISGGIVFNSPFDILQYAKLNPDKKVWIIGGAEIYSVFQKHCREMHITLVQCHVGLETNERGQELIKFTPNISDFDHISSINIPEDGKNELNSDYTVFKRKDSTK